MDSVREARRGEASLANFLEMRKGGEHDLRGLPLF
jgi:hypothetical protein